MESTLLRNHLVRLYKEYKNALDKENGERAKRAVIQGWVVDYKKLEPSLEEFMYYLEYGDLYPPVG